MRWWHRKILNVPPPMDTGNLQLHTEHSLWKRSENWMNRVSTAKGKRTEMRWVGESEIRPHQGKNDILATAVGPQLGTTSKIWLISLRSKGFELYIRQPNSQILYKREESLQYLTLKVSGKQTRENYRTTGNQKLTLKGLIYKLIWPEKQHKNIILKVHEP